MHTGVDSDARLRSKDSAESMILELSSAFFKQVANGGRAVAVVKALSGNTHSLLAIVLCAGVASRLAEEICWQILEEPKHRYALIHSGKGGIIASLVAWFWGTL
jgi:hypothetical protein